MPRIGPYCWILGLLAIALIPGCIGRNLESLTVTPATATAQNGAAQFIATGQFSSSPTSAIASVSWVQEPPEFDPPGDPIGFTLTNQPFTAQCFGFPSGTVITVIAYAPNNDSMGSGSIPLKTFVDLVLERTRTQEGSFVAATAQMTCP